MRALEQFLLAPGMQAKVRLACLALQWRPRSALPVGGLLDSSRREMSDEGKYEGMIATDVLAPTRVIAGKYQLGRILGEGGMGAVYEADHRELGAKVAVKLLSEASVNNPNSLARFRREAMVMGQIHHENVVSVMDAGTDDAGVPFLVMELMEGESLSSTLRRERLLSPGLSAWIIHEVLAGLGAAHAKNIVHRDLKPGNVFIATQSDGSRRVKLLDFGISKLGDVSATLDVTAIGALVGTPNFMAPEQITANVELDGRVDLYAAGVMLYRMVTGKLPYVGSNAEELYRRILEAQPVPPTQVRPELSLALETVIFRAMHPERNQRFQSAYEFQAALHQALPSESYNSVRQASRTRPPSLGPQPVHSHEISDTADMPHQRTQAARPQALQAAHSVHATAAAVSGGSARNWQWMALMAIILVAVVGGVLTYSITRSNNKSKSSASKALAAANAKTGDTSITPALAGGSTVYFGITRHKDPEKMRAEMAPFLSYLSKRIGRPVEMKIIENYDDFTEALTTGEVQLVAMSAVKYVRTKRKLAGLRLLATPTTGSGPTYGAYILARSNSGIATLADLKDRTFCYTSQTSSSGYIYPRVVFRQAGINPETHMKDRFTTDHMASLRDLQKGGCDGAAVYDKAWLEAAENNLDPSAFTVIGTTERIPWDAYCVADTMDKNLADSLAKALTDLRLGSPLADEVLGQNHQFSGFLPGDDSLYDPVRNVEKYLDLEKRQDTAE